MQREIFGPSRSEFEAFRPKRVVHAADQQLYWLLPGVPAHSVHCMVVMAKLLLLGLPWGLLSESSRLIRFLYGPLELNKPNFVWHEYS